MGADLVRRESNPSQGRDEGGDGGRGRQKVKIDRNLNFEEK